MIKEIDTKNYESEIELLDNWSWFRGTVAEKHLNQFVIPQGKYINQFEVPLHFARQCFCNWAEEEARECWSEFEIILGFYINEIGKKYFITNPMSIIQNSLDKLRVLPSFERFLEKWASKFQKCRNPFNESVQMPINSILGSLFILKNVSIGNMDAVMDMHEHISKYNVAIFIALNKKEEYELKLLNEGKNAVSKEKQKAARAKRPSIFNLVIKILDENPEMNPNSNNVWQKIKALPEELKKVYKIQKITGEEITFYPTTKRKSMKKANFNMTLSKAKKSIKSER